MFGLTKKTGYGLIAMTRLAGLQDGELASAREIAEQYHLPTSLMMNVLKRLCSAGYVDSIRGAHGGYRLARNPEQINLAEIITVVEGPIRLARCISGQAGDDETCDCKIMAMCPIVDPVHRVQRRLHDFLQTLTLAEIADPSVELANRSDAGTTGAKLIGSSNGKRTDSG